MVDKQSATLLVKVLESSETSPAKKNVNKAYIEIIINEEIPVLCINRDTGKKRLMPFKVLYDNNNTFWQKEGSWEFFINGDDYKKIKEISLSKPGAWDMERPVKEEPKTEYKARVEPDDDLEELEVEVGYGSEYESIVQMPAEQKIIHLNNNKQRLNELLSARNKDEEVVTQALVETAKDAALINHAALQDALILADDEAKKFTQEFVDSTNEMVKSSTQLIAEDVFSNELMNTLVEKSNGTVVQHMTRVFLNGIAFLTYFNNLITTTSAVQKLRISFLKKYRPFYKNLLPYLGEESIDLERVFLGGMRAIPPDMFSNWAIGFLIHDIGKASAIEYHEGEAAYDRNKVIEHVKAGYKSITTKTNYPMEACLITGYHHEYYGDPDGYGYYRAHLQQYKKQNPSSRQYHFISYELGSMMDYRALSYFPAKVLEIIDVYDSITDPHRIYRKAMTPEEALKMMREEFVEKKPKLDIILFDIFESFIKNKMIKV